MGVRDVIVENDEDVEVARHDERIYAQVKKRAVNLIFSDVGDALARFEAIRTAHAEGRRTGTCRFAIVTNSSPGPDLAQRVRANEWPAHVTVL